MTVFTVKMGIALYREHVGHAVPAGGGVFTKWFLNAGLNHETAEAMLTTLPIGGSLRQGRQHSIEQFDYRYNCNGKHIITALVGFHSNMHVFVIATSDSATYARALRQDPFIDLVPLRGLCAKFEG